MGKKLDAFLRRGFKTSKFRATVALAISRLAVLKNQRTARCSVQRSDVVQFLKNTNHDRALLRVEQVIKEQNMLDVLDVLEGYCNMLIEMITLIEQEKTCPDELKEAISTLIFASTRCGEFPELQEIRAIFASRFGKEFVARAVELRNNCGVNPKVIQKLSSRAPTMETKIKVLKEIASTNGITLPDTTMWKIQELTESSPLRVSTTRENTSPQPEEINRDEEFPGSARTRAKYKDVADAAQAAFESAAYAATAARAAMELSRSESTDPDYSTSPNLRPRKVPATMQDPLENSLFESSQGKGTEFKKSYSTSSSDSEDGNVKEDIVLSDEPENIKQEDIVLDESGDEDEKEGNIPESDHKNDHRPQVGMDMELEAGKIQSNFPTERSTETIEPLNINRRPISVRSRWARR